MKVTGQVLLKLTTLRGVENKAIPVTDRGGA
jgi:hypothetical protein